MAGKGGEKGYSRNSGSATKTTLLGPKVLAIGPKENIYISDTESHSERMIDLKTGKLELIPGMARRETVRRVKNQKKPDGPFARRVR